MDLNQLIPLLWAASQNTSFPISPNQILLAFWSMCSSQCLITQHISILTDNSSNMIDQIFWLRFCCLSLTSFWPYCKIPKSKSLEDFVSNFLSLPTRLNCQGISSQAPFFFYGACRLPALSTESKVGWLGLNFRKVSRRRIDQTFAPLPSPFQTNWGIWGFDALNIFRWEVALIMTAAVVLVKLMRRNTSENKRKQIDQTLQ